MILENLLRKTRWIVPVLALTLGAGPLACNSEAARHPKRPAAAARKSTGPRWARIGPPNIGYTQNVPDHDFQRVDLADKDSILGRIQRTERWRNVIETVEDKYEIPRGIIYAIVMNESYGDILQPNANNDGGLGLVHFQPGTARIYGLDIWGNSNDPGRDTRYGRSLRDMLENCRYAVPCVLRHDQRVHPVINLDAIARYLRDGYDRERNWDGAIGTINPGRYGNNARLYARKINRWRVLAGQFHGTAMRDFDQRNRGRVDGKGHPITWGHYMETFRDANEQNYGLGTYRGMQRGI